MEGKIVYKGQTKDGKEFLIRYPRNEDAETMTTYINTLSQEKTFIRLQGEKIKLEDENRYLKKQLKRIKENLTVQLFVICDNKIVGIAGVDLKDKTETHEGGLGISLLKEFRGYEIGNNLFKTLLAEAKNNLSKLRIITLEVFANNLVAQKMYKKFRFKEFGRLPKGIFYKNNYIDCIYMYREIK